MITELPRLMIITDRDMAEREGCGDLDDVLLGAASAGARFFQIRDKESTPYEFARFVEHVFQVLAGFPTTIVVNDRADVALAVGASGVHRPGTGLPLGAMRRLMEYRLVGASCHGVEEVATAFEDDADYATLSPIFETASKPGYGPPLGISGLETVCRAYRKPIYALGGITAQNAREATDAGAHGVAVMGEIMRSDDPYAATFALLRGLGVR